MINEEDVNQFAAKQLCTLRQTSGLTQAQVAEEIKLSTQQVQKYEWGINRLSPGRLMQFAEIFGVSVAVFFPKRDRHYTDEPVPPPSMRFMRLLATIPHKHYDQVFAALKAIAKLSGGKEAK